MAHTPGPWTADLGESYVVREVNGGRIANISFTGKGGKFGGRRPSPEPLDNALLIAAAPDLLEALESSVQFVLAWLPEYEGKDQFQQNRIRGQLEKAAAAIAKAKPE